MMHDEDSIKRIAFVLSAGVDAALESHYEGNDDHALAQSKLVLASVLLGEALQSYAVTERDDVAAWCVARAHDVCNETLMGEPTE